MKFSQEYVGAIVIFVVGVLQAFGVQVASDAINGIVVGVVALYVAFRRHSKGDITVVGKRV